MRPSTWQQRLDLGFRGGIVADHQHRLGDLGEHRPVQPGPLLNRGRDLISRHPQRSQQRIQRLFRPHWRLVVAVQVDEQHPSAEPASPQGSMPNLHREGGLANPRQTGHR